MPQPLSNGYFKFYFKITTSFLVSVRNSQLAVRELVRLCAPSDLDHPSSGRTLVCRSISLVLFLLRLVTWHVPLFRVRAPRSLVLGLWLRHGHVQVTPRIGGWLYTLIGITSGFPLLLLGLSLALSLLGFALIPLRAVRGLLLVLRLLLAVGLMLGFLLYKCDSVLVGGICLGEVSLG